jgi:glucose-6-phosphate 1-dehydrogenase
MRLAALQTTVQQQFCMETRPDPCGLVIFGASGDLAERKLFPSIHNLRKSGLLPKNFYAVGVGRTPMTDDAFRVRVLDSVRKHARSGPAAGGDAELRELLRHFRYVQGDYADPGAYARLSKVLDEMDGAHGTCGNRIYYLSLPPSAYEIVVRGLAGAGLARPAGKRCWSRVIVEKPFGRDLAGAQRLNAEVLRAFEEDQTYRIDHYLGKETVQSILVLRFANVLFEPVWNRDFIDHVQITAAESLGVGHRAGYYEDAGVMRDMFQNHLLQLLCITAMEPPASFHADRVRDEKVKVLRTLRFPEGGPEKWAVRGQYGPGDVEGKPAAAYRGEKGVAAGSCTETFAALTLHVNNLRWQGVPFYLRSGKRLARRWSEIAVVFKRVPHLLFEPLRSEDISPNVLALRIQPDEGMSLSFETKHPGPKLCMSSVTMDFNYESSFGEPPEAYERLLLDCMAGDQTLFTRSDWVDLSWTFLQPLLDLWSKGEPDAYPSGSWGPPAADGLLAGSGRAWRNPPTAPAEVS